jgi:hypothetical protein
MKESFSKTVLQILNEYLEATFGIKEGSKEYKKFTNDIAEYFDYFDGADPGWARLRLRLREKHEDALDKQSYLRNRNQFLRQLHFGFGMPIKEFLDDKQIYTKHTPPQLIPSQFIKLEHDSPDFPEQYFNSVSPYIQTAQKKLFVYEYLGKGNNHREKKTLGNYEKAHERVFDLIETQLNDNPNLSYKRLLALPYDNWLFNPEKLEEYRLPDLSDIGLIACMDAVTECSFESFAHICRCYKKFSHDMKGEGEDNLGEKVAFFIVTQPSHIHHYGIIDDNYVVHEHYRYNDKRNFIPDLLFIENANSTFRNLAGLLSTYSEEIEGEKGLILNEDRNSVVLERIQDIRDAVIMAWNNSHKIMKIVDEKIASTNLPTRKVWQREKRNWNGKIDLLKSKISILEDWHPNSFTLELKNEIKYKINPIIEMERKKYEPK